MNNFERDHIQHMAFKFMPAVIKRNAEFSAAGLVAEAFELALEFKKLSGKIDELVSTKGDKMYHDGTLTNSI